MKIITIVGARPQFIKMAAFSREISKSSRIKEVTIHTGQHFDFNMSKIFFDEMGIKPPDYQFETGGLLQGEMTGRQIEKIEGVLIKEVPDLIILYGDTNSTLAGAIAAVKLNIPIMHIESGLRSFNKKMPEEINRLLVDHISDFLLAPTKVAESNLLAEGLDAKKIFNVGDVMYDAVLFFDRFSKKPEFISESLLGSDYVLCTIHRDFNVENPKRLANIFEALQKSDRKIILPIHPRTKKNIINSSIHISENIFVTQPIGYLEMLWLQKNASLIITDSGGIQKEAFFHKKICLTLRNETEWRELVNCGANILVDANIEEIESNLRKVHKFPDVKDNFYGDGFTTRKIIKIIENNFA